MENLWQYIIIIAVAVIIAFAIIKSKRKDFKIEANKLIDNLGGKQIILGNDAKKLKKQIDDLK